MDVNICCSGSSGSTFFAHLLNRHPSIVCGQELALFSKPIFYHDYDKLKRHIRLIEKVGVSSSPFFLERSALRNLDSYGLCAPSVRRWIHETNSLPELAAQFKSYLEGRTGKVIWAEKTPGNSYLINDFLELYPDSKIIHLVRNPRDVILSLKKRGHSKLTAAMTWLTSVAGVQKAKNRSNVLEINYEDLTLYPNQTLQVVCSHLDIEFNMKFFTSDTYKTKGIRVFEGHETWESRPTDGFLTTSISQRRDSNIYLNDIIHMRISKDLSNLLGIGQVSFFDLIHEYKYNTGADRHTTKLFKNIANARQYSRYNIRSYFALLVFGRLLNESQLIPLVEY